MTPSTPAAAALRAIADEFARAGDLAWTDQEAAYRVASEAGVELVTCPSFGEMSNDERKTLGDHFLMAGCWEQDHKSPLYLKGYFCAAARLLQGVAARIEGEGDDGP